MDKASLIKQQTLDIVNRMVDAPVVEVVQDEDMYSISIQVGDQAPTVIGRHGETLRALQKILEVVVYKQTGERASLLINVNDYREKQVERLHYIADQAVQKVQERHTPSYLRGFSSYERRIMHEHVAKDFPELTSYSIGEGRERRLVIDVKGSEPQTEEATSPSNSSDEELTVEI